VELFAERIDHSADGKPAVASTPRPEAETV
jgi:hypothetical protein